MAKKKTKTTQHKPQAEKQLQKHPKHEPRVAQPAQDELGYFTSDRTAPLGDSINGTVNILRSIDMGKRHEMLGKLGRIQGNAHTQRVVQRLQTSEATQDGGNSLAGFDNEFNDDWATGGFQEMGNVSLPPTGLPPNGDGGDANGNGSIQRSPTPWWQSGKTPHQFLPPTPDNMPRIEAGRQADRMQRAVRGRALLQRSREKQANQNATRSSETFYSSLLQRTLDEFGMQVGENGEVVTPYAEPTATSTVETPTVARETVSKSAEIKPAAPTPSPAVQTTTPPVIQTKLTVNEVNDPFEQEADRVADEVMRMPAPPADAPAADPPADDATPTDGNNQKRPAQRKAQQVTAQRQEQQQEVQRSAENDPIGGTEVDTDVESRVSSLDGRGEPLSDNSRDFFESRMGADFGDVRIHRDASSAELSSDLNARAFTVGNNIAFNSGEYNPDSPSGKRLLAHELTHTVQQGAAPQLDRSVQRQETEGESSASEEDEQLPTPEEAAEAAAKAAGLEARAADAKATGEGETELSRGNAATERSLGDGPRGIADASKAEGPVDETIKKQLDLAKQEKTSAKAGQQAAKAAEKRSKADSASETVKAIPKPEPPAPVALPRGSAAPPSGAGLDAATATATATVETAFVESENPPDKAPISAEEDTGYTGTVTSAEAVGESQRVHELAVDEADAAQASAESPDKELEGQAQTHQVGALEQVESPEFDAAGFKAALMAKIAELAPSTAGEADEFKESGAADSIKGGMQEKVAEEQSASETPLKEGSQEAPDMSVAEPKPVEPLELNEPGETPEELGADKAVPKTKGEGEAEAPVKKSSEALDQQMADAEITDEQLEMANEPEFSAALDAKEGAKEESESNVEAYRQTEKSQIEGAESEAVEAAQAATQSMFDTRSGSFADLDAKQEETKTEDEKAREKIAADIEGIYEKTKTNVETILSKLDGEVTRVFDEGAVAAATAFEEYVDAKMEAYKEKRYGGLLGWGKWLKDKLLGMPSDVNLIYAAGRDLYVNKMDAVIDNIVQIIGRTLAEAKAEIANGKREIQEYVDQLPDDLKEVGQNAAQDIQSKFDDLEQQVNDKQGELIETLAQKYNDNLQAIDSQIEEMKAANKGVVQQAIEQMGSVIGTIMEMKSMLEDLLDGAAAAVMAILKDPIGFVKNLFDGVITGLNNFVSNFLTHLQKGFMSWLTGSLGEAGIEIPDNLMSMEGMVEMAMQMLGLTYSAFRAQAAAMFGEPVVNALETGFELFILIKDEGLVGAWEWVQDKLATLKDEIVDGIKEMLMSEVVEAGIKWLIGLLGGPAGAFVKACMAIYDLVMWFMDNASRLQGLIQGIISGVQALASGDVGALAKYVEDALADAVPIAIGLFASLLGIGDLSTKIRKIIDKVRQPIEDAIKYVLDLIKGFVMKIAKMLGIGGKGGGGAGDEGGIGKEVKFSDGEEEHRLWIQSAGANATVMVASDDPMPVPDRADDWETKATDLPSDKQGEAEGLVSQVKSKASEADGTADSLAKYKDAVKTMDDGDKIQSEQANLESQLDALAPSLGSAFARFRTTTVAEVTVGQEIRYRKNPGRGFAWNMATVLKIESGFVHLEVKRQDGRGELGQVIPTEPLDENLFTAAQKGQIWQEADGGEANMLLVKEAVQAAGGILQFMRTLSEGGEVNEINRDVLDRLWNGNQKVKDELKNNFRAANKGNHEWITCSMIMQVIDRTLGVVEGAEVADWISLQHNLRSDTSWVIFNPDYILTESEDFHEGGEGYDVMHGHPGALYIREVDPETEEKIRLVPLTQQHGTWNNELVSRFNANQTVQGVVSSLQQFFQDTVWEGLSSPARLSPYLRDSGDNLIDRSVMTSRQNQRFVSINATFEQYME